MGPVAGEVKYPLNKLKVLIALFANNARNIMLNLTTKDHSQRSKTMVCSCRDHGTNFLRKMLNLLKKRQNMLVEKSFGVALKRLPQPSQAVILPKIYIMY